MQVKMSGCCILVLLGLAMKKLMVLLFMMVAFFGLGWFAACSETQTPLIEPSTEVANDANTTEEPIEPEKKLPITKCNGLERLCDLPLNQVTFVRAHNAHAAEKLGYSKLSANHINPIPEQLKAGIRSLNVDVYKHEEEGKTDLYLCHGFCVLGKQLFAKALADVRRFMENNPHEVLLFDMQNEAPLAETVAALEASGLAKWAHVQKKGEPWPTLREMIQQNKRIVFWTRKTKGAPSWLHTRNDLVFGTPCCRKTKEELTCKLQEKKFKYGLFFISHTLTNPVASQDLAKKVNFNPFLKERIARCEKEVGQMPNLISIDFYTIGDVIKTVEAINRGEFPNKP